MANMTASEAISAGDELVAQKENQNEVLKQSVENQNNASAGGFLSGQISDFMSAGALGALTQNPIVSMGVDTLNQAVSSAADQLLRQATDYAAGVLAPFQAAVNDFFYTLAALSTTGIELGLEMARNAAKTLLKKLDEKDKVLAELESEISALYSACLLLTNTDPFLEEYLQRLLSAYQYLQGAAYDFDSVSKALKKSNQYRKRQFESGMGNLLFAKDLLLPPSDVKIDLRSGASVGSFIEGTVAGAVNRASNKEALAAALAIPGITYKIGKLLKEYSVLTLEIDVQIRAYRDALGAFINAYKSDTWIGERAAKHIDSGNESIKNLIKEMDPVLYPSNDDSSSLLYGAKLTGYGSFWGVKVTSIEEWMKLTPTKALEQLDATGASVTLYKESVTALSEINDVPYIGGKNEVSEGRENGFKTLEIVSKILITANLVVAKPMTPQNISKMQQDFSRALNHVKAMQATAAAIRSAVDPFASSSSTASSKSKKVLGALTKEASKLGLDRVVDALLSGKVATLYTITADTATFVGAAIAGLNYVIDLTSKSTAASQQDLEKTIDVRDELSREQKTKEIEATRSAGVTKEAVLQEEAEELQALKDRVAVGKEAAKKIDIAAAASPSLLDKTQERTSQLIPNFNTNLTQIG